MAETRSDAPLLDLTTLVERPKIRIDGDLYEMLLPDELSLADSHRLASKGNRVRQISGSKKELTKTLQAEASQILREVVETIMPDLPPVTRDRLTDRQRMAIAEVFTGLLRPGTAAGATTPAQRSKSTGAKRSRGSSASTGATPGGGSQPSPSRS